MKRRRILWLSHLVPYPPKGGALIRSHGLLRSVGSHHTVDLLALDQPGQMASYFSSGEAGLAEAGRVLAGYTRHCRFVRAPTGDGSDVGKAARALFWLASGRSYTMEWAFSRRFAREIEALVGAESYDLIHLDTISLNRYRSILPATVPIVLNHHNIESQMLERRARRSAHPLAAWLFTWEARRVRREEQKAARCCAAHLVCSELDRQRLLAIDDAARVEIVPNAVDVPEADEPALPARSEPTLLFVGGMSWYPNEDAVFHLLAEIWPVLRERHRDLRLEIVGRSPTSRIRGLVDRDPRVRLLGFVDDLEAIYRRATLFVCPIRDGGGTKLKILDAAARALPVVCYQAASEGIDFRDGVEARIASDVSEFVDSVSGLLHSPAEAASLGARARATVRRLYETESVGAHLAALYAELPSLVGKATVNECFE